MAKREKTKYPGVYFRVQERLDGYGEEKAYYVMYRRGGRGAKLIEEPVGRETEGMTAAKANLIRAARITGKEQTNTERRKAEEAARLADERRVTVASLWRRYEEANAGKPSVVPDRSYYKYLSGLSDREPASLTTEDVDALRRRLAGTKSARLKDGKAVPLAAQTQKHVLGLLRRLVHFGVKRDLFPMPQHLHFEMPRVDNEKTEVLTDGQLSRYLRALDEEPDQNAAALLRLALVTGMRKGALLALRWDDCDFERARITLRGEAAKKRKTEYIPMSAAARAVLETVEQTESLYIFPGKDGGKRMDFRRMARRVKEKAGLPDDFRPLHGLRHNFASRLASSGHVDMYTLQCLLTHESPQMTQRYAHLHDDTLMRAASVADGMLIPAERREENP
ncbi:MAG: site-specific integrase [Bilophila sp.]